MSAADLLRRAQAALPDASTEAAQLIAQAVQRLATEDGMRSRRIERERRRLMQAQAVLTCLAVALDEQADMDASDVAELLANVLQSALVGLDSVTLAQEAGAA